MAQLLLRNIDPETLDSLKNRARLHHRSLQGEIASILEEATNASTHQIPPWSPDVLKHIVGQWQGEPLTRPTQGDYEERDALT